MRQEERTYGIRYNGGRRIGVRHLHAPTGSRHSNTGGICINIGNGHGTSIHAQREPKACI